MVPDAAIAEGAANIARAAGSYVPGMPALQAALPSAQTYGKVISEGVSHAAKGVATAAMNHPYAAAAVGGGLLVAAAPAVVVAPALAAAGFGSEGIVLSSAAAAVHSTIGNAVAGSAFSTLTSAGMGGAGVAVVEGVVAAAGGAVAAGGALGGIASEWKGK